MYIYTFPSSVNSFNNKLRIIYISILQILSVVCFLQNKTQATSRLVQ